MMKKLIPPILLDIRKRLNLRNSLYYFGNFSSWDEALRASHKLGSDYEALNIIDQVDDATQKVRQGEALYEQDGVCYYKANNNWELLATLFYIKAVFNGNFPMSVLDLGGGAWKHIFSL